MLVRFEVENFRSILEPAELSMVAVDGDRPEVRAAPTLGSSLVTTSGIFGPNASGKSNVLASLVWVREAVSSSLRQWDETVPIEPFTVKPPEILALPATLKPAVVKPTLKLP